MEVYIKLNSPYGEGYYASDTNGNGLTIYGYDPQYGDPLMISWYIDFFSGDFYNTHIPAGVYKLKAQEYINVDGFQTEFGRKLLKGIDTVEMVATLQDGTKKTYNICVQ